MSQPSPTPNEPQPLHIDAVIPVYGERMDALAETILACLSQSLPFARIFVIDDGSPVPVTLRPDVAACPNVQLIRQPANRGISATRNAGIALSSGPFVACINCEVVLAPDWLAVCLDYLAAHPRVGACFTRIRPIDPQRLLCRWRMRFLETRFGDASEPRPFAPGHAVLLRRPALDAVGGYDERLRLITEDSDIGERMWKAGWETHYVAASFSTSLQPDTWRSLAQKQLIRDGWFSPRSYPLARLVISETRWLFVRMGRNLVRFRLSLLFADLGIWAYSLVVAAGRSFKMRGGARRF